jgi:hypothetical protein
MAFSLVGGIDAATLLPGKPKILTEFRILPNSAPARASPSKHLHLRADP